MRDAKTEQQLERGKFVYRYEPGFLISRIDMAASRANPARLYRRIDEERCMEMAFAMEEGVDFPAVVLLEEPKAIIVATGLHRLSAATQWIKPARHAFDAYIVTEPDPYRRDLLMRSINCIEGHGQTKDENLAHCVEMTRLYGGSIDDLAAAFNLRPHAIRDHLRYVKFDQRADEIGVGDLARLIPKTLKQTLGQIKIDSLLARTLRVIVATKAVGPIAKQLGSDVAAARSERAAMKILDEREEEFARTEERAKATYGRRKPDLPTKAMSPIRSLVKFNGSHGNDPSKLQFGALDEAQLERDLKIVGEAMDILAAYKREMTTVQKQHQKMKATASWKPSMTGEQPFEGSSPSA
jgi:hypothetical protein